MKNDPWLPIETAPKDRRTIDLFAVKANSGRRFADRYWWGRRNCWWPTIAVTYKVTHWMPIPAPPNDWANRDHWGEFQWIKEVGTLDYHLPVVRALKELEIKSLEELERRLDELKEVKGLGPKKLAHVRWEIEAFKTGWWNRPIEGPAEAIQQ